MNLLNLELGQDALFRSILSQKGKVAFVSGGGSGIGRAAVLLFSACGAKTYILDQNDTAGAETVALAKSMEMPGDVLFRKLDVTSAEECSRVISANSGEGVHILFNCAGISRRDADMDQPAKDLLTAVNVDGTKNMMAAVVPYMQSGKFGRIINMGSVVGYPHVAFPAGTVYKKSKELVHQFTLNQSLLIGGNGITVNALAPGRVMTDLVLRPGFGWVAKAPDPIEAFRNGCSTQRSGRMLLPEEVALQALFLCSPFQEMVNGTIVDLSDGWGTAGHVAWEAGEMPEGFTEFRAFAQKTTSTPITPVG